MREAGVSLATVGSSPGPTSNRRPVTTGSSWLDGVLDGLRRGRHRRRPRDSHGVATAVAVAPAPGVAPGRPTRGAPAGPGARQAYCPRSTASGARARSPWSSASPRATPQHPALRMWHVGNEYGCHTSRCYCDVCAARVPRLARERVRRRRRRSTTPGARRSGASATARSTRCCRPRLTPDGAWSQPDPAAGLPPVRLRPAPRGVPAPSATCCTGSPPASRSPPTSWS